MAIKGQKLSEETKRKIAESKKLQWLDSEKRKNMTNCQIGHKNYNKELKGCFEKDKPLSEKTRQINRIKGKDRYLNGNHPFIEINQIYYEIRDKDKYYGLGKAMWKKKSRGIFLRDKKKCQKCGYEMVRKYQCHHIIPYKISKNNSDDNLITLCVKCHGYIEYYTKQIFLRNPSLSKKFAKI
jgi:hypothetical protein